MVDLTIRKQTTQHNMWWTSLYVNKQHNTICGGRIVRSTTIVLCCLFTYSEVHHNCVVLDVYVVITIRINQTTQHNMWWTSLYVNKQHNTICGGHHYTSTTYCVVLFVYTTQHNMWWTSLYVNKQHNTICGGHHYT